MSIYEYQVIENATNIVDLFVIVNGWTNTLLANFLLIGFSLIILLIVKSKTKDYITSVAVSSIATSIISVFMWLLEYDGSALINSFLPILYSVVSAIFIILVTLKKVWDD